MATDEQQQTLDDTEDVTDALQMIRDTTGFGVLVITVKNGAIDEIAITVTKKPRLKRVRRITP